MCVNNTVFIHTNVYTQVVDGLKANLLKVISRTKTKRRPLEGAVVGEQTEAQLREL